MSFPRTVIDGNIGSGKSTQLKLLEKSGFNVKCEPIHDWPLKEFYSDTSRWAFLLQMSILKSFMEEESENVDVWERSPESSRYVFWKLLKGVYSESENDVYAFFYEKNAWTPDVHMYIRTSPEKCFERIKKRTQDGDVCITLEYLQKVHEHYENYIASKPNVIIIDGDGDDPEKIHDDIKNVLLLESHKKGNAM